MARACADDLAIALQSARLACDIAPVFREARRIAGLRLQPVKCKASVVAHGLAEEQARRLRDELREYALECSEFKVEPTGIFLGVPLGRAEAGAA